MNEARIVRKWFTDESTIGEFFLNGAFQCYTLEDAWKNGANIADVSAIPEGTYSLSITFSHRFQKDMPLISGVLKRSGIRIHTGNISDDTEGCILVGQEHGNNMIWRSKPAYGSLFPKLVEATNQGPIPIVITSIKEATV